MIGNSFPIANTRLLSTRMVTVTRSISEVTHQNVFKTSYHIAYLFLKGMPQNVKPGYILQKEDIRISQKMTLQTRRKKVARFAMEFLKRSCYHRIVQGTPPCKTKRKERYIMKIQDLLAVEMENISRSDEAMLADMSCTLGWCGA